MTPGYLALLVAIFAGAAVALWFFGPGYCTGTSPPPITIGGMIVAGCPAH